MSNINIKDLFVAGAHFGHKTSRWHPKMAQYIHSERNGLHIIDLTKTVEAIDVAMAKITDLVSHGKEVLFVGTKQQAREAIIGFAKMTGMPYVIDRWMGGQLTNHKTIGARIKHLKDLEKRMESGELAQRYSKLEVQRLQEEIDLLNIQLGGIKNMEGLPGAVFVVDTNKDHTAVKEATKLKIPIIALVDSNSDPSKVDFPIPCNDDAIKTIELIMGYCAEAVQTGKGGKQGKQVGQGAQVEQEKLNDEELGEEVKPKKLAEGVKAKPKKKVAKKKPEAKKTVKKTVKKVAKVSKKKG